MPTKKKPGKATPHVSSRAPKDKYKVLFESSATANAIIAEDSTILLVNSNFEKLLGYSREEIQGRMKWTSFVTEEYLADMKEYYDHRKEEYSTLPQSYEFSARVRSGEIKQLYISIALIPETNESMISLIDITGRKKMEEALKQSEERFRDLARLLPESVYEADLEGRIIYVNDVALERFGYTREDISAGLTLLKLVLPEQRARAQQNIGKLLKGEKLGLNEYMIIRKDGTSFPALVHSTPIMQNGQAVGLRGFLADISSIKRVEENLKLFQYTIDQASEVIFWLTRDGGFEYVNDEACRSLGYTRSELLGMKLWDIDPVLSIEKWESDQARYHLNRQGGSDTFESVHRCKDGTRYPVEVKTQFLWFGEHEMHVAVVRDISERKQAEKELHESEEHWRFAIERTGHGLWDWNMESNAVYYSPQCKAMLGYTDDEMGTGIEEWINRVHPDDFNRANRALEDHLNGTTPMYYSEHRCRCKNGEYRWFQDRGMVMRRSPEGKPLRMIGTQTDITGHRQELARYSSFIKFALDGLVVFDRSGHIVEANESYAKMLGYNQDELMGMFLGDLDARFNLEEMHSLTEIMMREGSARFETQHRRKDGGVIDVEVSIRLHEKEYDYLFVIIRDITEKKKAAAALENSLQEKQALLKELQHRMKNSLAMITSIVAIESERPENAGARKILDILRGRIDSLANLYTILFQSEQAALVNLDQYVYAIIRSLASTYVTAASGITIKPDCTPVCTDTKSATAWGLITNELLTNALKYAFPKGGGVIRVILGHSNGNIELAVTDDGPGPAPGFDIEHPTGFGLLLVGMLAKQLGGSFTFERGRENMFLVRALETVDATKCL
ncbi:MAG TPA: PAS domain S-box protein [Spirochaetota bacterium]|nr:PAS domain S-box protein [Spirochaetota bacterium]HOD13097.1 PAS domain S-box protein [Spirochaetota bacterium]HPG49669.1 PAS domain S-box protein [Spirochaetota bacterium]HPN12045.1 PAS domain S-box protein [Spirochaetota bacterium]HQL82070.1 PAS domain S-box protein [Spirochaetota bacterium]